MKKIVKSLLSISLLAMLPGCNGKKEVVTVSGSSSVTPIMEKLAGEYEKENDVRITINMSSSGAGISDTLNGLNDFGMSSRGLKDGEKGLKSENLCMDGIALIVNKDSKVEDVKKEDVKNLFEKGTAIPNTDITSGIGRDSSSGTRTAFDELLKIEGEYHSSIATLAETGNVIEAIKGSTNSIGYISYGSLNDTVKAVSLDGIKCTVDNIKNNSYALQRPFVLVTNESKELSKAAKGFYDYLLSEKAQETIKANGYISIR